MFLHILYQIFVIIYSLLSFTCYPSLDYDDSCGSGNSLGICKNVTECPTARIAIMHRKRHGLQRCGFHGITEVVCCPDSANHKVSPKLTEEIDGIWGRLGPPISPTPTPTPTPTPVTSSITDLPTPIPGERKSEVACMEYASKVAPGINYHILGGENASLGEFPHMAQIGFLNTDSDNSEEFTWDCGGALISDKFVLTAAHCTFKSDETSPIRVRLGLVDMNNTKNVVPQEFGILNILVHSEFQRRSKTNDIALIELDGSVERNNNVQPACLYHNNDDPEGLIITGWGYTTVGGDQSQLLQKAQIHAVDLAECSKIYERRLTKAITPSQICCISDDGTKDACQGDSGGPLQIQISDNSNIYTIVGITSFGMGCGGTTPGIYTRVSSYLDWIEGIVWP